MQQRWDQVPWRSKHGRIVLHLAIVFTFFAPCNSVWLLIKSYFVRRQSDIPYKYFEADIKGKLSFLVDILYIVVGDQVFQQPVSVPMGTKCAPILLDIFIYSKICSEIVTGQKQSNKQTNKQKTPVRVFQPYIQIH
jgi:hypothetical protein